MQWGWGGAPLSATQPLPYSALSDGRTSAAKNVNGNEAEIKFDLHTKQHSAAFSDLSSPVLRSGETAFCTHFSSDTLPFRHAQLPTRKA
jgi:hypothetical protein